MSASIEQKTTSAASTTGTPGASQNIIVLEKVKNNGVNQVVLSSNNNNNNNANNNNINNNNINNNSNSASNNIIGNNQKVRVISNVTVVSKSANLGAHYVELNNKNYINGNYSTLLAKSATPITTSTISSNAVVGGVITSNGKIINVKTSSANIVQQQCMQGISTTPVAQKISIPKKFQVVTTTKLNPGSHNISGPNVGGGLASGNIYMCRQSDIASDGNSEGTITKSMNSTPLQLKNSKIKTIKISPATGNQQQHQQAFSHLKLVETVPKDITKNNALVTSSNNYIIQSPPPGTNAVTPTPRIINSKGAKMICTANKSKYLTIKNSNIQLNTNDLQQVSHVDIKKKNPQPLGLLPTNTGITTSVANASTTSSIPQKMLNKPLAKVTLNYKPSNSNNNTSVINKSNNSNLSNNSNNVKNFFSNNSMASVDDNSTMTVINTKNPTFKIISSPTKVSSVNCDYQQQQQHHHQLQHPQIIPANESISAISPHKPNNVINGARVNHILPSSAASPLPSSPSETITMCSEEIMSARILQTLSTNSRMVDNTTRLNTGATSAGNSIPPGTHNLTTTPKTQKYKKSSLSHENSTKVSNEVDNGAKISYQTQYQINHQLKSDQSHLHMQQHHQQLHSQQLNQINNKYVSSSRTKPSVASPVYLSTDVSKNDILYAVLQDHTYFAIMPPLRQSSSNSPAVASTSAQSSIALKDNLSSNLDDQNKQNLNSSPSMNTRNEYNKNMGNSLLSPNAQMNLTSNYGKIDYSKMQGATSTLNRNDYIKMPVDDDANSVISSGCNSPMHNNDIDLGEETETAAEGEDDSITRCICDLVHDDGYMICCDKCSAWQHVDCMGIDRSNIPDEYLCEICQPRQIDKTRARNLQLHKRRQQSSDLMFTTTPSNSNLMPGLSNLAAAAAAVAAASGDSKDFSLNNLKNIDSNNVNYINNNQHPQSVIVSNATNTKGTKKRRSKNNDLTSPMDKRPRASKKDSSSILSKKRELTKKYTKKNSKMKKLDISGASNIITNSCNNEKVTMSIRNWIENYETAITNHYSPELRARLQALGKLQQQQNQQQHPSMKSFQIQNLVERSTTVPHAGAKILISTDEIAPDTPIIEIRGKYMLYNQLPYPGGCNNNNTIGLNGSIYNLNKNVGPFLFFYKLPNNGPEICVDTRTYGNDARFVRRSCRPNAGIIHRLEKGVIHLYIIATTTIKASTEISIKHELNEATQQYLSIISHTTGSNCACGLTKECNYPHSNVITPVFDKGSSRKLSSSSSSSTKQFKKANGALSDKQFRKRKQKKSESKSNVVKPSQASPTGVAYAINQKNNFLIATPTPSPVGTPPVFTQQQQHPLSSSTSPLSFTALSTVASSQLEDNKEIIQEEIKSSLLPTPTEMENKLIVSTCAPLSPKTPIKVEPVETIKLEPETETTVCDIKENVETAYKEEVKPIEIVEPKIAVKKEETEKITIQNTLEPNIVPAVSESPKESPIKPVSTTKNSSTGKTNKKMTREERKMEAIVKAFEKMEQYQQRKQEMKQHKKRTISSQSYDNDGYGSETGPVSTPTNTTSATNMNVSSSNKKLINQMQHQMQQKRKKRRSKQSPGMTLVKKTRRVKPPTKIHSSSGGDSSSDHLTSEESMPMMSPISTFSSQQTTKSLLKSPVNHLSQNSHSNANDMYDYTTTSNNAASLLLALSQPVNNSNIMMDNMHQDKSSTMPLVSSACMLIEAAVGPFDNNSSNSVTPEIQDNNDFKYPHKTKTKKTIMNEWLNQSEIYAAGSVVRPNSIRLNDQDSGYMSEEKCSNFELKNDISIVTKTLEDFIELNDDKRFCGEMFATNMENNGNAFAQKYNLQQDMQQNNNSPDNLISPTSILQSSIGGESAAKKRWLRQAISEECTDDTMLLTPTSLPSPTSNFTTPLKKRRVIREECSTTEEDVKEKDELDDGVVQQLQNAETMETCDADEEEDKSKTEIDQSPVKMETDTTDNIAETEEIEVKVEEVAKEEVVVPVQIEEKPSTKNKGLPKAEDVKIEAAETKVIEDTKKKDDEVKVAETAETVVFLSKASYKQSPIISRRSSLPSTNVQLPSKFASRRSRSPQKTRRSRSPQKTRRTKSPAGENVPVKASTRRSTLLSPVHKHRSPTPPPSILNDDMANFEKVIASFHSENIMILQSRNKKTKKTPLNGDIQKKVVQKQSSIAVAATPVQPVKSEIQLNFNLNTLQPPYWRDQRQISETNHNSALPIAKEPTTIYERYNYTKELDSIVKDDGYNSTLNNQNHVNPVSSLTFPVQNNINKYPDYRSSLLGGHSTNNLVTSSTLINNNNNNSINNNNNNNNINTTINPAHDYLENKSLYHHLNHNSTARYDALLNTIPSTSNTTKLIYETLPKLTPPQSLSLASGVDSLLLPTSKLLASATGVGLAAGAVGNVNISLSAPASVKSAVLPGVSTPTGAHEIYGVSKYFTKAASSDPRLNPNINAPEQTATAATPKRKLSITEYRKRKQQSNDSAGDVRRSVSSETLEDGNNTSSNSNSQQQQPAPLQPQTEQLSIPSAEPIVEKKNDTVLSAISIDLEIDNKIAQETSQLITEDTGTTSALKLN